MRIILKDSITIDNITPELDDKIRRLLTLNNPKYAEAQKMGRYLGKIPKKLRFYEESDNGLTIPRGLKDRLLNYKIVDKRGQIPDVSFSFHGELRGFQAEAVKKVSLNDFGTLSAVTGSGKTCMALYLIAMRQQPSLIVVHTKDLLFQWIERIETFLQIPKDKIGVIGAGQKRIGKRITVAMVQSLYKCADEVAPHIGHLIVDEAHRCPSRTFTAAITAFNSKYMLALTATPFRRDKLTPLIFWYLGDIQHEVKAVESQILKPTIITRQTTFTTRTDPSDQYSKMLTELTKDHTRNGLICSDISREDGTMLVLSDRKSHCNDIADLLKSEHGLNCEIMTGDTPTSERERITKELNAGNIKILVATGQLIGEGYDCKELSTLFLTTPVKFAGRLVQYIGRILRPAPGKKQPRVFDYQDNLIGPLKASAKARQEIYSNM